MPLYVYHQAILDTLADSLNDVLGEDSDEARLIYNEFEPQLWALPSLPLPINSGRGKDILALAKEGYDKNPVEFAQTPSAKALLKIIELLSTSVAGEN